MQQHSRADAQAAVPVDPNARSSAGAPATTGNGTAVAPPAAEAAVPAAPEDEQLDALAKLQRAFNRLQEDQARTKEAQAQTNEELRKTKEAQAHTNEELRKTKEAQAHTNEELRKNKEAQAHTNEELRKTNENLERFDLDRVRYRRELTAARLFNVFNAVEQLPKPPAWPASPTAGSEGGSTAPGSGGSFGAGSRRSARSRRGGSSQPDADATPPGAGAPGDAASPAAGAVAVKKGQQFVHGEAKTRAFHMSFKECAAARDSPVNTAAHLVKRSFLRSLSMFGADSTTAFPAPLVGTAQFFGPYPRELREKLRAGEFSEEINAQSLQSTRGAPLLQMSHRNIVLMPKGLEMSMDAGEWVLEPLLPRDMGDVAPIAAAGAGAEQPDAAAAAATPAAAEVWSPIMWRVKVLSGGDTEVDVNRRAADSGHARTPAAVYGFKNAHIGACNVTLSECAGIRFDFNWSLVSVRALVFTYLYTLAQQSCAGTEVPDPAPLTAGIARISEWLEAVKKYNEESPSTAAPSLGLVEEWLDKLARPSDASDDEHVRTEG